MSAKALLKNVLPKPLRFFIKDEYERISYFFPKPTTGRPHLRLESNQVYPEGNNLFDSFEAMAKESFSTIEFTPETPLASIGSCFAEEFASHALNKGYNYLVKEKNFFNASANWGRVYTTCAFKQIVDYSFDDNFPVHALQHPTNKKWYDPLRESSVPDKSSKEEMVEAIKSHRINSKEVFKSAKVLGVTVGQNETWLHKDSGQYHARVPLSDGQYLDDNYELHRHSIETNRENLKSAFETLFSNNPDLKVILTVSPVPSSATFFKKPVVTQSFANKCRLRVAVEEIVEMFPEKISYFPSFEIVLAHNPVSYRSDNRHVTYNRVGKIFGILDRALNSRL